MICFFFFFVKPTNDFLFLNFKFLLGKSVVGRVLIQMSTSCDMNVNP
jgi:hypothetical protein